MNKSELVEAIAKKTDMTKSDIDSAMNGMFEVLAEQVARGEKIVIPGYLSVERTNTKARKGRNPSTGAAIDIPAGTRTKVTAGSKLKAAGKK